MTGALSPSHWLIILVVLLLLFGAKRLPDAARGIGRSLRIFKAETSALAEDDRTGATKVEDAAPAAVEGATVTAPPTRTTNGTTV
ncbi:Sec-independent protein translocase subunit TatA [Actinomycetospora straminea]|uniref:Sec-independent protein translocase protein TatA n=1 Tax=Actinomycetospora straminea TaxID=663607 RepID=A0ABP9EMK2_9PSEU|nr:Sec-independent protein translocase subunit TatA [Actinomycetospora straminea]MDD7934534.1 Sec-independent protein translocase subunit TatA [Actinomycetospora straminea]